MNRRLSSSSNGSTLSISAIHVGAGTFCETHPHNTNKVHPIQIRCIQYKLRRCDRSDIRPGEVPTWPFRAPTLENISCQDSGKHGERLPRNPFIGINKITCAARRVSSLMLPSSRSSQLESLIRACGHLLPPYESLRARRENERVSSP